MYLVVGHPRTRKLHDSIRVIVERMTKSAHFIPMKSTYRAEDYAKLYIDEIARWHGIPLSIISDRGSSLLLTFEDLSTRAWIHARSSVMLLILKWMDKQSVPFRPLMTC